MLDAGPKAADEQRQHEEREASAGAGKAITGARERRAERQDRRRAETLGNQPGGNLKACHRAGEQRF
jgi:hypothetical protein